MVPALGAAVVVAVVIGWGLALAPAGAQAPGGSPSPTPVLANPPTPAPAPANVRAVNGMNAGEASVLWDAVDGAAFYRIGWVAYDDIDAARAEGRNWLDAFDFKDVENRGQTTQLLKGLAPGAAYAFIAASVERRFGVAHSWSDWVYLTMATADATSCPTDTGTEPGGATPTLTPTPMPTPTPTLPPTPRPTPTGTGDYDMDKDGLIEVSNLAQLAAIRADLDGDGISPAPAYAAAFPDAMPGMGCPDDGCIGYELVADLDFDSNGNGEADAGDAYWNDGAGWIPIGDSRHTFTADFDGNNHTIANLYISRSRADRVGLFGSVSSSSIKQVGIVSVAVSGGRFVGGLVGSSSDGTISASYATGSVSGDEYVGGLVGHSRSGAISDSYARSSVSGSTSVGGLVGGSEGVAFSDSYAAGSGGAISDSYATGSVSGDDYVGGLVGSNHGTISTISGSYATGSVTGNGGFVGGLVGNSSYGNISGSYATGSVSGSRLVGGLVGSANSVISGSYATGSVSGNGGVVGGLVGESRVAITASYATGNVSGADYVGGLAGRSSGVISGSYATGSVSGSRLVGGLVGSSRSIITASYAMGSVSGSGDDIGGLVGGNGGVISASYAVGRVSATGDTFYIGGLVGYDGSDDITASYWDTETSGQAGSYGGIGKTTAELQSPVGYTGIYAGWNLDLDRDATADDPWEFGNSRQYPALQYGGLDVAAQRR